MKEQTLSESIKEMGRSAENKAKKDIVLFLVDTIIELEQMNGTNWKKWLEIRQLIKKNW